MKTALKITWISGLLFFLISCGPPSESRENMDRIADRTFDSIQKLVDSSMNAPLKEVSLTTSTYVFEYK